MITREEYEAIIKRQKEQKPQTQPNNVFSQNNTAQVQVRSQSPTQQSNTSYRQEVTAQTQVYSNRQTRNYVQTATNAYSNTNITQTNTQTNNVQRAQQVNSQRQTPARQSQGHKYLKLVVDENGRRRYQMVSTDEMDSAPKPSYNSERVSTRAPVETVTRMSQRSYQPGVQSQPRSNMVYQPKTQVVQQGQPPRNRSQNKRKVVVYRNGVKVSEKLYDN